MRLEDATLLAMRWQGRLMMFCERVEIAGSVRRRKPDVHDIELVAVPLMVDQFDLFGNPTEKIDMLERGIDAWQRADDLTLKKNGPRMKQIVLSDPGPDLPGLGGITIDLFIVRPPAQWGVIFAIRTGPADFSHWLVTKKSFGGGLPSYLKVRDGVLWNGDQAIDTPEEEDFFREIGLEMVGPASRSAPATWRKS